MPLHLIDDNDDPQMKHLMSVKRLLTVAPITAMKTGSSWKVAVSGDAMDESGGVVGEISLLPPHPHGTPHADAICGHFLQ